MTAANDDRIARDLLGVLRRIAESTDPRTHGWCLGCGTWARLDEPCGTCHPHLPGAAR